MKQILDSSLYLEKKSKDMVLSDDGWMTEGQRTDKS